MNLNNGVVKSSSILSVKKNFSVDEYDNDIHLHI